MKLYILFLLIAIVLSANAEYACKQPPSDPGVCKAYFPKWSYDPATGECVKFIYGGCGGNSNRFDTKDECEIECTID